MKTKRHRSEGAESAVFGPIPEQFEKPQHRSRSAQPPAPEGDQQPRLHADVRTCASH